MMTTRRTIFSIHGLAGAFACAVLAIGCALPEDGSGDAAGSGTRAGSLANEGLEGIEAPSGITELEAALESPSGVTDETGTRAKIPKSLPQGTDAPTCTQGGAVSCTPNSTGAGTHHGSPQPLDPKPTDPTQSEPGR